jgi:MFS family permease
MPNAHDPCGHLAGANQGEFLVSTQQHLGQVVATESLSQGSAGIDKALRMRALGGSAVGSAVEWYDYFLYGTMAGIVFGPLFFPSDNPSVSLMLSFASFALAFLVRPVGGVLFSHIGDRIGRKKTLVVTLSLMGGSTMLMGFLPDYATVGIWAPILLTLLRLIQGLALGGEWGGGLLLAVEYAPRDQRGFYGAVPQTGALFGLALGSLAASITSSVFSDADFMSFGWRIPFLLSFILVLTGLWIRNRVDETPSFKKVKSEHLAVKVPVVETLKHHWRAVLITIGAKFVETSTFFIFATFSISYAVGLGYAKSTVLDVLLLAAVLAIPVMLFFGGLSDRIGRKRIFVGGTIAIAIYAVPYFWLMSQKSVLALTVAMVIGFSIIWSSYGSVLGTIFAESFSANVRYTGISLGYQIGAALVGGPAPLIATALLVAYNYIAVAGFVVFCAAVSLVAISFAQEMRGKDLDA